MRTSFSKRFPTNIVVLSISFGSLAFQTTPVSAHHDPPVNLVVSFEQPGAQSASFQGQSGITTETFGTGSNLETSSFSDSPIGVFTHPGSGDGIQLLSSDKKAGTANAYDGDGTQERMLAVKTHGSNQYVRLEINSGASDLRYLGFWWGSGNNDAGQNTVEFWNNGHLQVSYDASQVASSLSAAGGELDINDYLGNPNYCWPVANDQPASRFSTCTASDATRQAATAALGGEHGWVQWQPYAYIHFRLETGFDEVRFWRGSNGGFEMDNMSVSTQVPAFGETEVASIPSFTLEATDLLLVDPRDPSIGFNGVALGGSSMGTSGSASLVSNATICIAVVQDNQNINSPSFVASPNLNIVAENLTISSSPNRSSWALSGPKGDAASRSATISFQTIDDSPLLSGESIWLRVGAMNGSSTPAQCSTFSQSNEFVRIRALTLSSSRAVSIDIDN